MLMLTSIVVDPMMILLLMNVIHHPRRRLPNLPPKLLPLQQPQNLQAVRVEQEGTMGRGSGEVGVEIGEVCEELGVF